jgi:hypothetical protein
LRFITPVIYAAATYGFFHWLDKKVSEPAKRAISSWLEPKEYDRAAVAAAILELFDNVYTRPLLAWRAFIRSALITLVISVVLVYEIAGFGTYVEIHLGAVVRRSLFNAIVDTLSLPSFLAVNIVSDFIALFIIRRWLCSPGLNPIKALILGPVIGMLLVFACVQLRITLDTVYKLSFTYNMTTVSGLSIRTLLYQFNLTTGGAVTLAAFIVHLWLPFFALCVGVLKGINYVLWPTKQAQWFLKRGKDHPLDAIGFVAAPLVFLIAKAVQVLVSK